jgi:DNA polymerase-3 subunit delta
MSSENHSFKTDGESQSADEVLENPPRIWSAVNMSGTVHVFELLDKPLAETPAGVCAVFGGERFLKKLAVNYLINSIGAGDPDFAASEYDSDSVSWADVHDELLTRTLFGGDGPRIVVVDHADKFVKENRERLEAYVGASNESGLLVLIVESWASNTRLYKAIDKSGLQIKCDAPLRGRSKQRDEKQVQDWLIARAKSDYEFELPAGGAQVLIELTDCEFGRMDQELQKLALYADEAGQVTPKTIKEAVGGWRSRTMWEAIDAATEGDAKKSLELLDQLLRSGEHPLALFGQMSWSLRRYATATEIVMRQLRRGSKPDLGAAIKAAGFRAWGGELKAAESRIKQLGRQRAGMMMDWLLEADLALKRTHSKEDRGRLVLETLFVKMSKELSPTQKTG